MASSLFHPNPMKRLGGTAQKILVVAGGDLTGSYLDNVLYAKLLDKNNPAGSEPSNLAGVLTLLTGVVGAATIKNDMAGDFMMGVAVAGVRGVVRDYVMKTPETRAKFGLNGWESLQMNGVGEVFNPNRFAATGVSGADYLSGDDLSGDDLSGDELSGDELSGDELSGDELSGDELSGDDDNTDGSSLLN